MTKIVIGKEKLVAKESSEINRLRSADGIQIAVEKDN